MIYRLTRAGAVDLVFDGDCLADTSSRESEDQQRWAEVRIYRTESGKYVAETIGRTLVPGEIDRVSVKVVERAEGVAGALRRRGDNRHTVNRGDPNREYLTDVALEAMQAAGERDAAIAATLVERI